MAGRRQKWSKAEAEAGNDGVSMDATIKTTNDVTGRVVELETAARYLAGQQEQQEHVHQGRIAELEEEVIALRVKMSEAIAEASQGAERFHATYVADVDRLRDEDAKRIADMEDVITTLRSQLLEQEHTHKQVLLLAKDHDETTAMRVAEVLRHNGELVEEKRLLGAKLRETIENYEGTITVLSDKLATTAPRHPSSSPAPHRWTVRQAADDRSLEMLLNLLSESRWTIDQIYEPRGGAYRVIAWKNNTEEQGA